MNEGKENKKTQNLTRFDNLSMSSGAFERLCFVIREINH